MSRAETPPPVPEGVLIQSVSIEGKGVQAGYRIYRDGRYESRPRGDDWSAGAPLDAATVDAVRAAIESSAIDALPERLDGASESGNPPQLWFSVAHGDGMRTVLVTGDMRVPELEALTAELTRVVGGTGGAS